MVWRCFDLGDKVSGQEAVQKYLGLETAVEVTVLQPCNLPLELSLDLYCPLLLKVLWETCRQSPAYALPHSADTRLNYWKIACWYDSEKMDWKMKSTSKSWSKRLTLYSAEGSICQESGARAVLADMVDCKTSLPQFVLVKCGVCLLCTEFSKTAPFLKQLPFNQCKIIEFVASNQGV